MSNEKLIWDFLKEKGLSDCGIAGLMGNLLAESGLNPKNLQDIYNNRLGLSDEEYTKQTDNGSYQNFIQDCAGYGLAQWTYYTRKQKLLNYAKNKNRSIGDLETQLEFLIDELKTSYYSSVYQILVNAKSISEASNAVLLKFECPADQSLRMQQLRISYSQSIYSKYHKEGGFQMSSNKYKKGKAQQLSKHFSSTEMDCHGVGCCSETLINPKLIPYLEQIREHFGKPITITSGYRCPIHNRNVGGATGSRHSKGDAADIVIRGVAPREVAKYAESIGVLGIGLYETNKDGHFVHIDTRDYKSFWYGQGQAKRTTFGGESSNNSQTNNVLPSQPTTLIRPGSKGESVKQLQQSLEKLGYDLSPYGADGSFGQGTLQVVKKFQKDNGLVPDGIAGPETLKCISQKIGNVKKEELMEVTATGLNVRQAGNINAPIVSLVRRGQKVKVLEVKNGWGKIENPHGWVSMDYLK